MTPFPYGVRTMDLVSILIERVQDMAAGFVRMVPQLFIALIVLLIAWGIANIARAVVTRIFGRARVRPSLATLFVTLAGIAVWIFGVLVALAVLLPGVTAGSLLTIVGVGSVAIGFAFKDIFENFLAGVLIMMRRKMRIGDHVKCEGEEGRIEQITLRETYLRRLDSQLSIVPNSFLFKNPVLIITDANLRRHEVIVGVSYTTDLDQAAEVIERAVRSVDMVIAGKPIEVFACEFADSAINLNVRWWSGSKQVEMHRSRDQVIRAIKRALDEAGIVIPFPQLTASFLEPLKVERL
ncbi:MAG TPA: mechanosensitive ion channel [Sphingomicrobium sp.]|nr:mechanosensitive ion channel [Sphingomicrobium sp.]